MTLLILEVSELFDLPLPDATPGPNGEPSEQERKIGVWTRALIRTVPAEELFPTLDYVIDHHDKDRAINAMDIKRGYAARMRELEAERRADREQQKTEPPACSYCDEEKMEEVWLPGSDESFKLPCSRCRPHAYAQAIAERKRKMPLRASSGENYDLPPLR